LGVSSRDQSQNNNNGEDQEEKGEDNSDLVQRSVNSMGLVVGTHGDDVFRFNSDRRIVGSVLVVLRLSSKILKYIITMSADHKSHGVNTPLDKIRIVFSLFLLIFSIVVVLALVSTGNTQMARDVHPAAAAIIMWGLIVWMSMVEGGQCSMAGLPPVDRELYRESHPITYKITGWGHKGDNCDRYLMGRQFMVIFINFTIGLCGGPLDPTVDVLGLPDGVKLVFLDI
jgi:hypothetical protein